MRETLIRMGKQLIVKFMAWKNIPCPMFSNSRRCLLGTINPTGIWSLNSDGIKSGRNHRGVLLSIMFTYAEKQLYHLLVQAQEIVQLLQ